MISTDTTKQPAGDVRRRNLADVLGLPNLHGRRLFVSSTILDSLSNGVVFAFLLIYFASVTSVDLGQIGAMLTVGRLVALLSPPLAGALLDRFGSRSVIILGNWISCVGVVVAALTSTAWQIALSQLLVQVGMNFYWTCSRDLVAIAAQGEELPRWFGLLGALRNVGIGAGSVVASVFLVVHSEVALRLMVGASALGFLLASLMLILWKGAKFRIPASQASVVSSPQEASEGQRALPPKRLQVLSDGRYLLLLAVNLIFVLIAMFLPLVVAIWTTEVAHLNATWAGVAVVINTALVALFSTAVVKITERRKAARVVALAFGINAASFLLVWLSRNPESWLAITLLVAGIVAYSVAEMMSTPYMNEWSVTLGSDSAAGQYQAAFQMSWSIGMAIAPVLFTSLLAIGPETIMTVLIGLSLVGVVLTALLARKV